MCQLQMKLLERRLKGETYFIRAYEYSMLLMNYGGAVILTEPSDLDEIS